MAITITNDSGTILVDDGGTRYAYQKRNMSFKTFGNYVLFIIDNFEQLRVDYTEVTTPSSTSAADLLTKLEAFLDIISSSDIYFDVARGKVEGFAVESKFGRNPDIDTGSTPEDIWAPGGVYTGQPLTGAETIEVFSDDAADTSAGTGARTIQIFGLDENWEPQNVTVTLNGTTPVATTEQWQRVFRAVVLTAGSGGENAGGLTIRHTTTTANIFAILPAGNNQTTIAAYTIPAGKTGYLNSLFLLLSRANGSAGSAHITFRIREEGGVFRAIRNYQATNSGSVIPPFKSPVVLPAKTDIKVRCEDVSDSNTEVSAEFDIILEDNIT